MFTIRALPLPGARSALRAVASATLLILVSLPAEAQLGGLVRKAKDKATNEAARKTGASAALNGESVTFNNVILELDATRVDQVLKGLEAGRQALLAPGGRRELATRRDSLANVIAAQNNAHSKEIDAHNQKRWAIDRCRNDAFRTIEATRQEEFQKRAQSDPVLVKKIMDMSIQASQAMAKGDSATYQKLMAEARTMNGATKSDSLVVDKRCGAEMAPHPQDVAINALQKQSRALDDQIRDAEQAITAAETQASGMNERQFAMARERIEMYLARAKASSAQKGFTATELKALDARRDALASAM